MTAHGHIEPFGALFVWKKRAISHQFVFVLCVIYTPNFFLNTVIAVVTYQAPPLSWAWAVWYVKVDEMTLFYSWWNWGPEPLSEVI